MPQLEILLKGRKLRDEELTKPVVYMGREPNCDIVLSDPDVSRRHARLIVRDGKYWLEDLESTHGVFLNGRPSVNDPIDDGDRFQIGNFVLRYHKDKGEVLPFFHVGTETDQEIKADLATLDNQAVKSTLPGSPSRKPVERQRSLARTQPHLIRSKPLPPKLMALKHHRNIMGTSDSCHVRELGIGKPEAAVVEVSVTGKVTLRKLGLKSSIFVQGKNVSEHELQDGDTFTIGAAEFVFRSGRGN